MFLQENNVSLIAIVEHIVQEVVAEKIMNNIEPRWERCTNYEPYSKGRIWILWDPSCMKFFLFYKHAQIIHGSIHILDNNVRFEFTAVLRFTYSRRQE